jgi:hypothetical protein
MSRKAPPIIWIARRFRPGADSQDWLGGMSPSSELPAGKWLQRLDMGEAGAAIAVAARWRLSRSDCDSDVLKRR